MQPTSKTHRKFKRYPLESTTDVEFPQIDLLRTPFCAFYDNLGLGLCLQKVQLRRGQVPEIGINVGIVLIVAESRRVCFMRRKSASFCGFLRITARLWIAAIGERLEEVGRRR
jgi:hypothetical protein